MAKEVADLTTIDLFSDEKRPGRPKTNPHSRSVQVKINKRNQVKRDKNNGLKRIEFKLHQDVYERLDALANDKGVSRSELIEALLVQSLDANDIKV
ncbi:MULTISPECIES: LexA regulated protein [unclassified Colwellia]|uniref:LexA regulated protein n=1 Tax=unclassified Colwellia TaxID=196834 RepID=UPI0015F75746|nr:MULTISPECIES: LexA regulated protein [unclassified Colwellia]MBA6223522.1 LexA regulated protein [Colwellia sp. MB3u-45]MBA6269121.1 LexA regulated protein [Colwellia sp. MB3u-43]MBA6289681.1 LexA regulated protein [Colwellia sp. MB3u-4]MBA6296018.1 LexA regulated protein [Colwellia sp. MB02u-9]MBA6320793.1 LexA regulated protein [Colwellia sp. MB02u-19]